LTSKLRFGNRSKELIQNTLIKVLQFERCVDTVINGEGDSRDEVYLKVTKLSIISQDPGHKFGNPVYFYDVCDYDLDEDEGYSSSASSSILDDSQETAVVVVNPHPDTPIVRATCEMDLSAYRAQHQRQPLVAESQALHELYYCQYQIRDKPIDSKVPNSAWQVDSHGVGPGPKCRWIHAASPPVEESGDQLNDDITPTKSTPSNRRGKRSSALSSTLSSASKARPTQRTSSFNAFAASVLPLPVQSRYSLALNNTCSNGSP
jgi:hypothetical protein